MTMSMLDPITLTQQLIAQPSVTPTDAECQHHIAAILQHYGFTTLHLPQENVANLWACYGNKAPLLMFAGHTDVVPSGELSLWTSPPFIPTIRDGYLFGRGAADMKGSLAAMICAATQFIEREPDFNGSIAFLITSGEEGDYFQHGTPYVMQYLKQQGIIPQYCIVGEPSCAKGVGDTIKVGRRGSLTGYLKIIGKQGHVAYPHLANNPIHHFSAALKELCETRWDEGNAFFPATTFQISNINAGTGEGNVIPGELNIIFNFRYGTASQHEELQHRVAALLKRHHIEYQLSWRLNGEPFLTSHSKLITVAQHVITTVTGIQAELSTSGGTSDGRFIAPYGVDVIEFGPVNRTIHQVNECISLNELSQLKEIFYGILGGIF